MTATCQGVTRDGRPCGVRPLRGGIFCINHDPSPEVSARRDEARRAGGESRGAQMQRAATPPSLDPPPAWWRLSSMKDAIGAYSWVVRELANGQLDARTGNAITGALGGLVGALREGDLEKRLEMLETTLTARGGRR